MYLNCKSFYSFRYGTFSTEELVLAARRNGTTSLGLTNINGTTDVWDFVHYCRANEIKPVAGAEIRNGDRLLYVLLAASNDGLEWINRFLSKYQMAGEPFPVQIDEHFFGHAADGFVIYPFANTSPEKLKSNERIGLLPGDVRLIDPVDAGRFKEKYVIWYPVTFQNHTFFNVHRLLRAIDKNTLLSKLPASAVASPSEVFLPESELKEIYAAVPFCIENTVSLIDACELKEDFSLPKNKQVFSTSPKDDFELLCTLAHRGCDERYGDRDEARERLETELAIISRHGYAVHFLIAWNVVAFAREKGFLYIGRGTATSSVVAYCLRLCEVDPIELDLDCEFLENAATAPEFGFDFSPAEREQVTEYLFARYGRDNTAILGMHATFQFRAVVRELGKVFGLAPGETEDIQENRQMPSDQTKKLIYQYGRLITNFPNHLSSQAGGVIITEHPVYRYTALSRSSTGFPSTQIDMYVAQRLKISKIDVLSQKGLLNIKHCLRLIRENRGQEVSVDDLVPLKNDVLVRKNLQQGDTAGCFYIESPGMRQLLKKLACNEYHTLLIALSVSRPGVIQSGMMREFVRRYHDRAGSNAIDPVLAPILGKTLGVMVFQEDLIRVARQYAGLDDAEVNALKNALHGKYDGADFDQLRTKFFESSERLQRPKTLTLDLWRQITGFSSFSFSKAHAANFAVESLQSLYLKTYFPKEFIVSVINNSGGLYSRELYFLELRKTGVQIHAPCVNRSEADTSLSGNDVYAGFALVKTLDKAVVSQIIAERRRYGSFLNLHDFIERTNISREQLNILIGLGALRFTGKNKKQLFWEAGFVHARSRKPSLAGPSMFAEPAEDVLLPRLADHPLDDAFDEMELLDFPLCDPFKLADVVIGESVTANDLPERIGQTVTMLLYFIHEKAATTARGEQMNFVTFVDRRLDCVDTVHFPDICRNKPLTGRGFYSITGKVVEEYGVLNIQVEQLQKVGYKNRTYLKV